MDSPDLPNQRPNPGHSPSAPPPWWHDRMKLTVVTAAGVLAVVATALLLIVLNTRGGEAAVASPTPTASADAVTSQSAASASVPASPSATVAATLAPTATPPPPPTPPPAPPAVLAVGWARVSAGGPTREEADPEARPIQNLVEGDVIRVISGPIETDGSSWYQVVPVNGDTGWLASGPTYDPAAEMVETDDQYPACGPVTNLSGYLIDGVRPGRIGEAQAVALDLVMAKERSACVTFSLQNGLPAARLSITGQVCGAPTWDGNRLRMGPTDAGHFPGFNRIKHEIELPSLVYTGRAAQGADGFTNLLKVAILGSQLDEPRGCIGLDIHSSMRVRRASVTACLVVTERTDDHVSLATHVGGDALVLTLPSRGSIDDIPIGTPRKVAAYTWSVERSTRFSEGLNLTHVGDC